jgi:hypothetical protein
VYNRGTTNHPAKTSCFRCLPIQLAAMTAQTVLQATLKQPVFKRRDLNRLGFTPVAGLTKRLKKPF